MTSIDQATLTDDTRVSPRRDLLSSELSDTEVVMLDLDAGTYFGCEGVAKVVWDGLEQPATIGSLVRNVRAAYPDAPESVRADVIDFLVELHEAELVSFAAA